MGSFIFGAISGLTVGIIFSAPIWNWIKDKAGKVKDAVEKNQTPKP